MKFHVTRDQKAGIPILELYSFEYFRFESNELQVISPYIGNDNALLAS